MIDPMDELRKASADLQSDTLDVLQDALSAICAAHTSLRSMAGVIETSLEEDDSYRYEDLSGDIYCIRHVLQLFESVIQANGLKGDGIKWRI